MEVEAGQLLDDVVVPEVDRDAVRLGVGDDVGEVVEPPPRHEVGPWPVPGPQRPADDLLALGDVEPALGLGPPAQHDVGERHVVGQPRVGGVGDLDRHAVRLVVASARPPDIVGSQAAQG